MLLFELTMPNVGSWNGKWTGEKNVYAVKSSLSKKQVTALLGDKEQESWYYNFGDGWGVNISCRIVTSAEATRVMKRSSGFCGYEWMVTSIIKYGEILNPVQQSRKSILRSK